MTELPSIPPAQAFERFPILQTERLIMRELRDEDVAPAHRMFTDPEVMRYIGRFPHSSIEQTRQKLSSNQRLFPEQGGVRWAITLRERDAFIGSCGHWRLMKEHRRSEIGYDLLPEYWGKGIMTEALRAALRFGFVSLQLHSTEAQIDPENQRSRQVLERLGFRQDGLLRENFYFAGRYSDTACFTLLGREFLAQDATISPLR